MSIMWKYLDKRKAVIDAMKDYSGMQFILEHTEESVRNEYQKMTGVGSPSYSGMPKAHNPNAGEERIINCMEEIDVLKERYRQAVEYMEWFQPAWQMLSEEERYVLECFYEDEEGSGTAAVYAICDRFGIERTSAYKKKNRALDKLVIHLYGKE